LPTRIAVGLRDGRVVVTAVIAVLKSPHACG
jgi:hypothetical protein